MLNVKWVLETMTAVSSEAEIPDSDPALSLCLGAFLRSRFPQ